MGGEERVIERKMIGNVWAFSVNGRRYEQVCRIYQGCEEKLYRG
jgi:hypothetical protein